MDSENAVDMNGTGWVFRIYAMLAAALGLALSLWGPLWLGAHLPGLPFYKASLIRVAGGVLLAVACGAWPLDSIDDPAPKRRLMLWFGIGHCVLFAVLALQQSAIWESRLGDTVAMVVLVTAFIFFYCRFGEMEPPPFGGVTVMSIFHRPAPPAAVRRSSYRRQLREAARQEERHRLARDLHDSVKQQIFAIQTAAATAQARFDSDAAGARAALDQVRAAAREAMGEMEAMLDQLRAAPLENSGLVAALKSQCEALGFRTGAKVELQVGELPDSLALEPGAQEAVLRVAQEALANVARHARASLVRVSLTGTPAALKLSVEDDGAGFDPAAPAPGMGIANMRARAVEFSGTFEVVSSPGAGAAVRFTVPAAAGRSLADYNRRIAWYGGLAVLHFAIALWRGSSFFSVMGVMWTAYALRIFGARKAALLRREVVR